MVPKRGKRRDREVAELEGILLSKAPLWGLLTRMIVKPGKLTFMVGVPIAIGVILCNVLTPENSEGPTLCNSVLEWLQVVLS